MPAGSWSHARRLAQLEAELRHEGSRSYAGLRDQAAELPEYWLAFHLLLLGQRMIANHDFDEADALDAELPQWCVGAVADRSAKAREAASDHPGPQQLALLTPASSLPRPELERPERDARVRALTLACEELTPDRRVSLEEFGELVGIFVDEGELTLAARSDDPFEILGVDRERLASAISALR